MAYVTANRRGGFEVRESRATPNGPRSRTLATFRRLDDEVIERARSRASKPPSAEELREAALRAGAPVAAAPVDRAAAETVRRLAAGERVDPMLRRLLLDALRQQERSERVELPEAGAAREPEMSAAAREASEWIGVGPERRSEALWELLAMTDAFPHTSGSIKLSEKVVALHSATARTRHAFGGEVALAYYGEPRTTVGIELRLFVPVERWPEIRDALKPLGVNVKADEAALQRDGQVRLWWDRNPVDLFFAYDPFHDEMRRATRRVPFAGETIPILAPEHLAVCKAMFDRPKDWLDIEQMVVATDPLDLPEVEAWLVAMVGVGDQRLVRLREILTRLGRDR